jgi:U2-associated protein SR140
MARKRFESTLRSMSGKRVEIARAMEFALKRAEAADEVCHISFSTHDLESCS